MIDMSEEERQLIFSKTLLDTCEGKAIQQSINTFLSKHRNNQKLLRHLTFNKVNKQSILRRKTILPSDKTIENLVIKSLTFKQKILKSANMSKKNTPRKANLKLEGTLY